MSFLDHRYPPGSDKRRKMDRYLDRSRRQDRYMRFILGWMQRTPFINVAWVFWTSLLDRAHDGKLIDWYNATDALCFSYLNDYEGVTLWYVMAQIRHPTKNIGIWPGGTPRSLGDWKIKTRHYRVKKED